MSLVLVTVLYLHFEACWKESTSSSAVPVVFVLCVLVSRACTVYLFLADITSKTGVVFSFLRGRTAQVVGVARLVKRYARRV